MIDWFVTIICEWGRVYRSRVTSKPIRYNQRNTNAALLSSSSSLSFIGVLAWRMNWSHNCFTWQSTPMCATDSRWHQINTWYIRTGSSSARPECYGGPDSCHHHHHVRQHRVGNRYWYSLVVKMEYRLDLFDSSFCFVSLWVVVFVSNHGGWWRRVGLQLQ